FLASKSQGVDELLRGFPVVARAVITSIRVESVHQVRMRHIIRHHVRIVFRLQSKKGTQEPGFLPTGTLVIVDPGHEFSSAERSQYSGEDDPAVAVASKEGYWVLRCRMGLYHTRILH